LFRSLPHHLGTRPYPQDIINRNPRQAIRYLAGFFTIGGSQGFAILTAGTEGTIIKNPDLKE
jgi:hypothetical protein